MKYFKIIALYCASIVFFSCNNKTEQASISGTIKNLPEYVTEVLLKTPTQIKKINIENNQFSDTINIDNQFCFIQIGRFQKTLFLNQNTQLNISLDANDYQKSLIYSGEGKQENNYLNEREIYTQGLFGQIDSINSLDSEAFKNYKLSIENKIENLLDKYADINSIVLNKEKENLKLFIKNIEQQYNAINNSNVLKAGDVSPEFNNYENYKGGTTSLKDLRGNYVYIDIWATWCGPCVGEIPHLKLLEEKLHDKKIKFVSISLDTPNAKGKWRKMIQEKNMGGIQLFANNDQEFSNSYNVTGIPRFILLDKQGNIISANASRPSQKETYSILRNLQ